MDREEDRTEVHRAGNKRTETKRMKNMRLLKLAIHGLRAYQTPLDLEFVARQRVVKENSHLYELLPRVYQNSTLMFIGDNSSGKSPTLEMISYTMRMLEGIPLSQIRNTRVLEGVSVGDRFHLETYFMGTSHKLYRLETTIRRDMAFLEEESRFIIEHEVLYEKEFSKIRSRKNLFAFEEEVPVLTRKGKGEELPADVSIAKGIYREEACSMRHLDLISLSEEELLQAFLSSDKELLPFTAPQIEKITLDAVHEISEAKGISLKFFDMDPFFLKEEKEIYSYLSPGLMRSTVLLHMATKVLKHGGYLLVDGLEKEMSKDKAVALLHLFGDPEVNRKGACLLATTLDPDLLDEMERNDGIYLLHHDAGIQVTNLAELLTRNDLKKSEVYRSGALPGTAPLKIRFQALLRHLKDQV